MHYLVLGGGSSPEKDVSHRSATAVKEGLESLGHTVTYIDPSNLPLEELLATARQTDGVFPILHGFGGEDGTLQEYLSAEGIPYFGPDTTACANTYDKVVFKKILEENGIITPRWNTVSVESLAEEPLTKTPFVLKPIGGGSSIDTFIVRSIPFDSVPLLEALSRYDSMLIEELIEGSEITVGVLDGEALPVVEIIPPTDGEFDYENKYNGATAELCPPVNVSEATQAKAQTLALAVHAITQCRHLSRTDMLINDKGELFVIDTNTIPGLTSESLFPKAAKAAGYDWVALVERFTKLVS
jgi:D-alanine-D-alanine ligase